MVSRAATVRSRAESRFPLPSLLVESAMGSISPQSPRGNQALEQRVLGERRLLLVDLARLPGRFDLHQLGADRVLVVELALGLLLDALGEPHRAPDRGEREREQSRDQAHAAVSSSVK